MKIKPVATVYALQKTKKVRQREPRPEQRQDQNSRDQNKQQGDTHIDEIV